MCVAGGTYVEHVCCKGGMARFWHAGMASDEGGAWTPVRCRWIVGILYVVAVHATFAPPVGSSGGGGVMRRWVVAAVAVVAAAT